MTIPQRQSTGYADPLAPNRSRRLVRSQQSSARWLQIILDQILVVALFYGHAVIKGTPFDMEYRATAVLTVLLMAVIYQANGVYSFTPSIAGRFLNLAKSWVIVLGSIVAIGFITKTSTAISREVFLTWSITGYVAQCLAYLFVKAVQSRSKEEVIPTLIIGARDLGAHLTESINENQWIPDQVVGVIEDSDIQRRQWPHKDVPILGTLDDLGDIIQREGIRRVYIALPMQQSELVKPIYLNLADSNVDVIWAPDIFGVNLLNHSIREMGGVPLICLSETPLIGSARFLKTIMDITIAMGALIVVSPVMLVTAIIIKCTSPGPVLFSQQRHGWNGRIITVYKFRSMKIHEEQHGTVTQARRDDDRITWIGGIIRRTSIDELPQLFNVLAGNMSIVGPRPHAVVHNEYYSDKIQAYMTRHRVKPGLTGLAQVNGYRGETQTLDAMADRVQYDLAYINNWSPWLDIQIIFRTVFVLFGKNAY